MTKHVRGYSGSEWWSATSKLAGSFGAAVVLAMLTAGCGGSARDGASGAAGSANGASGSPGGRAGSSAMGTAGAPPGAQAPGGTVAPPQDAPLCVGDLDKVANGWAPCPPTLCAAKAMAQDYCLQTSAAIGVSTCGGVQGIVFNWTTHGTICFYGGGSDREPQLVGATEWNDVPTYCNSTSTRISAGNAPQNCDAPPDPKLCSNESTAGSDGSGAGGSNTGGASGGVIVEKWPKYPLRCFDQFSHSCEPCCPAEPPDCTGQPDGYPGYSCTSTTNPFCSCACASGAWSCAC